MHVDVCALRLALPLPVRGVEGTVPLVLKTHLSPPRGVSVNACHIVRVPHAPTALLVHLPVRIRSQTSQTKSPATSRGHAALPSKRLHGDADLDEARHATPLPVLPPSPVLQPATLYSRSPRLGPSGPAPPAPGPQPCGGGLRRRAARRPKRWVESSPLAAPPPGAARRSAAAVNRWRE